MSGSLPPLDYFIPAAICVAVLALTAVATGVYWLVGWLSRGH